MSIGYIIAGLVFLFNPHINIIDLMPDALGYGLILYGILRLSRVENAMSDAANRLKQLFILSLCKLPCLYVYALISPTEQIWILLLSLVFGAAEAFFGVLAFGALFRSLDNLANAERDHGIFKNLQTVRVMTLIFVIAKPLFAVLPDLTLLADDRYGTVTGGGIVSLQSYRTVFTVFAFAAILVFGIVWLVTVIRYFKAVSREKGFLEELSVKIESFYREDTKLSFRYYITTLTFLFYALIFCLELKIEGYSILPPMISAVLFIITAYLFYRNVRKEAYCRYAKGALFAAVSYFVTSLVGYLLSARFADRHYNDDIGGGFAEEMYYYIINDFEVFDELFLANLFVALSQIAFVVMAVCFVFVLREVIAQYTGIPESTLDDKDRTASMIERDEKNDREIKTSLVKGSKWFLFAAVLTALSSAVFPLLEIYFNLFFTIDLLIRIFFVAVSAAYVVKLRQAVRVKGALDLD